MQYDFNHDQKPDRKRTFLVLFNIAVAAGIIYMITQDYNSPGSVAARSAKEARNQQDDYESSATYQAKQGMRLRLKDPDSAQFRNVNVHRNKKNSDAVCGEVNARNSLGGYSGFEPFFVTPANPSAILQSDLKPSEFRKLWKARCVD